MFLQDEKDDKDKKKDASTKKDDEQKPNLSAQQVCPFCGLIDYGV